MHKEKLEELKACIEEIKYLYCKTFNLLSMQDFTFEIINIERIEGLKANELLAVIVFYADILKLDIDEDSISIFKPIYTEKTETGTIKHPLKFITQNKKKYKKIEDLIPFNLEFK